MLPAKHYQYVAMPTSASSAGTCLPELSLQQPPTSSDQLLKCTLSHTPSHVVCFISFSCLLYLALRLRLFARCRLRPCSGNLLDCSISASHLLAFACALGMWHHCPLWTMLRGARQFLSPCSSAQPAAAACVALRASMCQRALMASM